MEWTRELVQGAGVLAGLRGGYLSPCPPQRQREEFRRASPFLPQLLLEKGVGKG